MHVHSAVLMQHRELQRGHSPRTVSRLAQRSECSSWLQECKQLHESMRKCVMVSPASCSLLLLSSHRQAFGRSAKDVSGRQLLGAPEPV